MARPRTPTAKAEVSGATAKNPQRFKDRAAPKRARPVGDPYARMTDEQKGYWEEFKQDMPWLLASDRVLLRLACMWAAKLDDEGEFGVSATQALSSILSKLGASPSDISKVAHGDDGEEDPADAYFTRPN